MHAQEHTNTLTYTVHIHTNTYVHTCTDRNTSLLTRAHITLTSKK
uniref:Uncharacterized protein n=1 Tax=Anguilla anguilla TaxID=7936 RepID=A0A0E9SMM3_ANGAN